MLIYTDNLSYTDLVAKLFTLHKKNICIPFKERVESVQYDRNAEITYKEMKEKSSQEFNISWNFCQQYFFP